MNLQLYSYLFGLFGTDGTIRSDESNTHITGLTLELVDQDILIKIQNTCSNCVLSERIRNTNFKNDYHSYLLYCHDKDLIQWFEQAKIPIKNKTDLIQVPLIPYSKSDFWRGVIDGDGSLGMKTVEKQPFISLTIKSEMLKNSYCDYIFDLTGFKPTCNRNKRDNIYNITLHGEKAIKVLDNIYKDSDIYLDRKYRTYLIIKDWTKQSMKGVKKVPWTKMEENDLITLSIEDFQLKYPNRTLAAIKAKKRRLKEVMLNVNE